MNVNKKVLNALFDACFPLLEHVDCLIVTLAKNGVATFVQVGFLSVFVLPSAVMKTQNRLMLSTQSK